MRLSDLLAAARRDIEELFPWDLSALLDGPDRPMLLDVREPYEFEAMCIADSINVPRGVLEQAVEWDFVETVPELIHARDRRLIIVCRSGNRSLFAGVTLQLMGFNDVASLATGLKGWNDYDQPLVDNQGRSVDGDAADEFLAAPAAPWQINPARRSGVG